MKIIYFEVVGARGYMGMLIVFANLSTILSSLDSLTHQLVISIDLFLISFFFFFRGGSTFLSLSFLAFFCLS